MTYYDILEVSENASTEVIKMAYKALVKKYHPDVFIGDREEAEEKLKQLNTAFEVLSDETKRKEYDIFLFSKKHNNQTQQTKHDASKASSKNKNNQTENTSKSKNIWIICILLFLCYIQAWHPYFQSELYDQSLLLGIADFLIITSIMMIVPVAIATLRQTLSNRTIKKICIINSVTICSISIALYVGGLIPTVFAGWLNGVIFYFVNKHTMMFINHHNTNKKKSFILTIFVFVLLVSISLLSTVSIKKDLHDLTKNSTYYTDIAGATYNLNGYENYAIIRTITVDDKFTAEYILAMMELKHFDEKEIIAIMDKYGAEQSGGTGHLIAPNDFVDEIDEWCFADGRKKGDIKIIQNPYGYSICYISVIHN